MPEKLQYQMKVNKRKKEARAAKQAAEEAKKAAEQPAQEPPSQQQVDDLPVIEETQEDPADDHPDNSRFQDSFRSDASFIDESMIETVAPLEEADRMTVIAEADEDAESRATTTMSRKSRNMDNDKDA